MTKPRPRSTPLRSHRGRWLLGALAILLGGTMAWALAHGLDQIS